MKAALITWNVIVTIAVIFCAIYIYLLYDEIKVNRDAAIINSQSVIDLRQDINEWIDEELNPALKDSFEIYLGSKIDDILEALK